MPVEVGADLLRGLPGVLGGEFGAAPFGAARSLRHRYPPQTWQVPSSEGTSSGRQPTAGVGTVRASSNVQFCREARTGGGRRTRPSVPLPRWGARRGANGEQTYALNGPELHSMAPNGAAPTCGSHVSAGRRTMASLVHTYGLFQVSSTDINCIKPQVSGRERHRREPLSRVSSSYFWEQIQTTSSARLRTSTSADEWMRRARPDPGLAWRRSARRCDGRTCHPRRRISASQLEVANRRRGHCANEPTDVLSLHRPPTLCALGRSGELAYRGL
jgi:hypothetical protein